MYKQSYSLVDIGTPIHAYMYICHRHSCSVCSVRIEHSCFVLVLGASSHLKSDSAHLSAFTCKSIVSCQQADCTVPFWCSARHCIAIGGSAA